MNPPVQTILLDLLRLVRLVRSAPVKLLKNGLPGKRFLQSLLDGMVRPVPKDPLPSFEDSGYPLFLFEQAYQLELVEERGGLLHCNRDRAESFFLQPPSDQLSEMLELWRMLVHWNEMRRVTSLVVQDLELPAEPLWTARRLVRARKQLLASLPSFLKTPLSLSKLIANVLATHPDLLSLAKEGEQPYVRLRWKTEEVEERLQFPEDQRKVEGEFVRVCVTESLSWLGVVDLGTGRDPLVTWRGIPASRVPGNEIPPFLVQPNLTILVFLSEFLLPDLFTLEQFAMPLSGDQILQYKLEESSFLQALQFGLTVDDILSFLQKKSRVPLPQNVEQLLLTWHEQSSQFVISEEGTILETNTPEELEEALSSFPPSLQCHRIDETKLFLPASSHALLQAWSKTAAVVELDYHNPPPRSINIQADLSVQVDLTRTDLFIRPFLEQIAVLKPSPQSHQEHWQILPQKLNVALESQLGPEELFAFLEERAHIFSSTARFRLEAFCGLVGEVSLGTQEVLLTESESVLDRLLYEGGLREFAVRIGPTAALVPAETRKEASDLLKTFSMPTTDTPVFPEKDPNE